MNVAIIGGGICGLYLSWKLSKRGISATVFEKKKEIGKDACSGLFSPRILKFIPQSRKIIQNKIDYCLINFPRKQVRINFSSPFLVMSHYHLDKIAASLAEKAGANISLSKEIKDIPKGFDKIIGCDGALSGVRKKLNLRDPECRLGIQFLTAREDFSNFVEVWATRSGFLWKIPRGEETEYGVIEEKERAHSLFEKFLLEKEKNGGKKKSALVPQGFIIPKHSDITLCGDAAGLTKPWSGGGVVWGLTAADILLKNFPDFFGYYREVRRFFLPKMFLSQIATKLAYFLGFKAFWFLPKNVKIENDFLI